MFHASRRRSRQSWARRSRPSPTKLSSSSSPPRSAASCSRGTRTATASASFWMTGTSATSRCSPRSWKDVEGRYIKELLDAQDARFANRPIPGTHASAAVPARRRRPRSRPRARACAALARANAWCAFCSRRAGLGRSVLWFCTYSRVLFRAAQVGGCRRAIRCLVFNSLVFTLEPLEVVLERSRPRALGSVWSDIAPENFARPDSSQSLVSRATGTCC